jgi:carbon storage regulator CsrA
LVLTRKQQEQLVIELGGRTVLVRVVHVRAGTVRLGISAPDDVAIHREETWKNLDDWQSLFVDTASRPDSA